MSLRSAGGAEKGQVNEFVIIEFILYQLSLGLEIYFTSAQVKLQLYLKLSLPVRRLSAIPMEQAGTQTSLLVRVRTQTGKSPRKMELDINHFTKERKLYEKCSTGQSGI